MLFDHRLNAFINFMTVRQVLEQYSDVQTLQSALYKEMESMGQLTDINLALNTALYHAQRFIDGEMDVIGKVEPMVNSVFNPQTGDDKTIPNVRCLIFTDGYQYNEDNYKVKQAGTISGNPFSSFKYNGENVNILMGAFHGEVDNPGFDQLKNVMGKCPVHNLPQFFHFSEASQTMRMKNLFRMGSGPGGFCEKCLDSFMRDYS
jgi:hypothetical protein